MARREARWREFEAAVVLTVGRLVRRAQGAKFQFVCVAKPDGSRAPSVHDLLKCINRGIGSTPPDVRVLSTAYLRIKCDVAWRKK
jgi:hypothetical protein